MSDLIEYLDLDPLLLIPLAVVLFLMALPIISRRRHGQIEFIDPVDLTRLEKGSSGPRILDLRSARLFAAGHVSGAVNIPAAELKNRIQTDPDSFLDSETRPVVLICQSDLESIKIYKAFRSVGLKDIRVMKGGMYKWKRSHLTVETD